MTVAKYNVDTDALDTLTYSFTNKKLKGSSALDNYWAILKSVSEFSVLAGDTFPQQALGSIDIDNSIGSFGANRKFSDVLTRYEVVDQEVVLYVAETANDTDTVSSWTTVAKGYVESWGTSLQGAEPTLTFTLQPVRLRDKTLTLEVSRAVSGMAAAPESSLGRAVPLIIGSNQQVVPVRISADGSTTASYAWGTCLYGLLKNVSSSNLVYTKNWNDRWQQVLNLVTDMTAPSSTGTYYDLSTYSSRAFLFSSGGQYSLATGVRLVCKGNGLASSSALLSVFVLRVDLSTLAVVEEVARGRTYLSNYNTQNAASTSSFDVNVSFDQPVYLDSFATDNYTYAVGWECTGWAIGDLSIHRTATPTTELRQDDADSSAGTGNSVNDWKVVTLVDHPKCKFLTTTFTYDDHVSAYTQSGLTYSKLTVTQSSPDSGQTAPPLDSVPLALAAVQGLSDFGSGTEVSEVPSLVQKLSYTWSGSAWADPSTWDTTTLSSSHYAVLYNTSGGTRGRYCTGMFDTKVTFTQVVTEVCRASASRVGVFSSGKLYMYPWGKSEATALAVPSCDVTGIEWKQADTTNIVNRVILRIGRSVLDDPRDFEVVEATDQGKYGYLFTSDFSADAMPAVAAITKESRKLFGQRDALDTSLALKPQGLFNDQDYLSGTVSSIGSIVAEYLLTRFAKPPQRCTFVVPYHRYSTVEQFQVITFASPSFGAFYGTDPDAEEPVYQSSTTQKTNLINGYEWVRAETYRGLVEGKALILPNDHAPAIRLTVLILNNSPFDPT